MKTVKAATLVLLAGMAWLSVAAHGQTSPRPVGASSSLPAVPPDGATRFGWTMRNWDGIALKDPAFGDQRPFNARFADVVQVESAGKLPGLFGVPTIWQNTNGSMEPFANILWQIQANQVLSPTSLPLITWNAQTGWDVANPAYAGITTDTINSGSLDGYIASFAHEVKAYGAPVFIRPICGEANGNWWRNCSPNANPALTASDFVLAWHRITQIFKASHVRNVAWVWNMNTFPPPPADWNIDTNIANYYPGDGEVQWVGADHYDYGPPSFLDPHIAFAGAHHKPFFLAEWGIRHSASALTPSEQQAWLESMFDYMESHLSIKATVYFNYHASAPDADLTGHVWLYDHLVNYEPGVNNADCRLLAESGASFRATYARRISNARYVAY